MRDPNLPVRFDEATRRQILASLEMVGKTKPVGYLPKNTISNILQKTIESITTPLTSKGLRVKAFGDDETCIKNGAVFVFDPQGIEKSIIAHRDAILAKGWRPYPDDVIEQIAKEWYDSDDPIMPFIRDIFGD